MSSRTSEKDIGPVSMAPAPSQNRAAWIDAAKGFMIVAVVIGHAWRGLNSAGLLPTPLFALIDQRIYAFHMPVFFVLSGWFYIESISKRSIGEYFFSRSERILKPLVIWTYIYLIFKLAAGSLVNNPVDWSDVIVSPLPTVDHFWYLWALFLLSLSFLFLKSINNDHRYLKKAIAISFIFIVVISNFELSDAIKVWIGPAIKYAPYFLLGVTLGKYWQEFSPSTLLIFASAAIFVALLMAWPALQGSPGRPLIRALLVLSCIVMMSGMARKTDAAAVRIAAELGLASLAIYVAHTIFSAAARIVLLAVGWDDIILHMALGTILGVVGPFILYRLAVRYRLTGILGL